MDESKLKAYKNAHPVAKRLFALMVLGHWRSQSRTFNLRREILRRSVAIAREN